MKLSRRTFLKGSGGVTGSLLVSYYGLDQFISDGAMPESGAATSTEALTEEWVPTTCWIGKQDCGMLARLINGRLVKLEGNPAHPRNVGGLCPKGVGQIQAIYDPRRVKTPLRRTNEKGVSGRWQAISWEEALTSVADQIDRVRQEDPKQFVWQKGRSKAKSFYDDAFVKATGAEKLHHGAFCSDAGYRAAEYTIGLHGVMHPDFRHTEYLLSFGWGATDGGGNKFCQLVWSRQLNEARARGMKMVAVDPSRRSTGSWADEWLPIRPGTDMALFLAIANRLIDSDHVDRDYLTAFTDAPSLVLPDGTFLKREGKEQVYDLNSESVVAFDTEGAAPALEGAYTVDGVRLKTGFEMLKEHVKPLTPEWAATITGLPATQIAQVATDMGEAASIGSTTVIDGVTIPYRPVAIMAYHVAQQELGFQALRAAFIVEMLLGAIGAVGGQRTDFTWNIYKNYEPFGKLEETITDGPYNIWLNHSKFYPINSNNSSIAAAAMLDPDRWEVDVVPKVCLVHHANPAIAFPDSPIIQAAYMKFDFVAVVDPWMSETADLFADIVLPAATIEKYEGPMSAGDQYVDAKAMRVPPIPPLYESRGEIDIYLDLCEKLGVLHGEGGYIDRINVSLKLSDDRKLDLATKPSVRDIFDRWSKDNGIDAGIAFFERGSAVQQKGALPPGKTYGYAVDPPFAGARHRLYGASLQATQDVMKAKGVDEIFWRLYTALPTWMTPTMENSPPEYDLVLINHKKIEFKQARTNFVPLLNELAPEQRLEINPRSAAERGIDKDDEVWIESHNAVTGERRKVRSKVSFLESVRPDTVSMPHHYGHFSNPITEGQGPSPNTLFFTGPGYVANTADQGYQVKVRVWKA